MAPTLADLTEESSFELVCLVGHEHLGRPISAVHVAEIHDPSPWLREEVFLLTTDLVDRTPREVDEYFQRLALKRVSAIGFGVGVGAAEVPDEWIHAASAHDVPILRVPLSTPYIAIAEFVRRRQADTQLAQVHRMINAQQRLAHSDLSLQTQRDTLEALANELNATVYWRSSDKFERTVGGEVTLDVGQEDLLSREITHHLSSQQTSSTSSIGDAYVNIARTAGVPIAVIRRERYTPLEQGIIGTIATFLDLSQSHEISPGLPDPAIERILTGILEEDISSAEDLAKLLLDASPNCIMVCLGNTTTRTHHARHSQEVASNFRAFLTRDSRASEMSYSSVLTSVGQKVGIAFATEDLNLVTSVMRRFFSMFERQLEGWSAGVSEVGAPQDMAHLFRDAVTAQQADIHDDISDQVRTVEETRSPVPAHAEVLSEINSPLFLAWKTRMDSVSDNDSRRILTALFEYLRNNGVIEHAAHAANVHRQTLLARLQRAESVLNVSTDSPTDRALLWVAFQTHVFQGFVRV